MVLLDEPIGIQEGLYYIGEVESSLVITGIALDRVPFELQDIMVVQWPTMVNITPAIDACLG